MARNEKAGRRYKRTTARHSRKYTGGGNRIAPGTANTSDIIGNTSWKSELAKLKDQFSTQNGTHNLLDLEHENRPVSREQRFAWISEAPLMQLHNTFIAAITTQGFMLVHQQYAHERVVYEKLQKAIFGKPIPIQQSLFPVQINLQPSDAVLLMDLLPEMKQLGYHIEAFDATTFVVNGTPADVDTGNEQKTIEQMLDQFKHFNTDVKFSKREKLIRTLACQQSIKSGKPLQDKEMKNLLEQLFLCSIPNATPSGKPTYINYKLSDLEKIFG